MPNPNKPDYTHGSTGTKPDPQDYDNGQPLDANVFDYYINELFETLKDVIDQLNVIDSDGDGVVDEADYANDANASTYKSNDIDTDGDGKVNNADTADTAKSFETRTTDPSNPDVGRIWYRSDLD